uniref:Translation initiation factor eIF-4E n=1 Tax=Adineta vaga TaxID=104782 RepID=B5AH94_ADIVA|nr:translation initiation factor eIF-4E [Adineta vaga]
MSINGFQFDRNDSISDDLYTTPISPLSPLEKSPTPPPLPLSLLSPLLPSVIVSLPMNFNGDNKEINGINEMQVSNNLTYPLEDSWTFWFFKNDRNSDWKDNLIELATISTVESFWSVFDRLKPASGLNPGCDYLLFKKNIQPMWEDQHNRSGGRWCLNTHRNQRSADLDTYWLYTLLSIIGDQYGDDAYNVNGCVVSIRNKGDRICLWTRDWRNTEATRRIGNRFREVADIPRSLQLAFEVCIQNLLRFQIKLFAEIIMHILSLFLRIFMMILLHKKSSDFESELSHLITKI